MRAKYCSRFELVTPAFGEALRDRVVDRARECIADDCAAIFVT
jgi:hypothetical protein